MSRLGVIRGSNTLRSPRQKTWTVDFNCLKKFNVYSSKYTGNIVRLDGDRLINAGIQGCAERKGRKQADKDANNHARAQFLAALGASVGLTAGVDGRGTPVFSEAFFQSLKKRLGSKAYAALGMSSKTFTRDERGYLNSGKPLTERRISRIYDALIARENERPWRTRRLSAGGLELQSLDTIIDNRHRDDFRSLNELGRIGSRFTAVKVIKAYLGLPEEADASKGVSGYFELSDRGRDANRFLGSLKTVVGELIGRTDWGKAGDGAQFEKTMNLLTEMVNEIRVGLDPKYLVNAKDEPFTFELLVRLCREAKLKIEAELRPKVPDEPPKLSFDRSTSSVERLLKNIQQMFERLPDKNPFLDFKTLMKSNEGNPVLILREMSRRPDLYRRGMNAAVFWSLHGVFPDLREGVLSEVATSIVDAMSRCLENADESMTLAALTQSVRDSLKGLDTESLKTKRGSKPMTLRDEIVQLSGLDRILVSGLYAPAYTNGQRFLEAVMDAGGGLGSSNRFDFKIDERSYSSMTQPQRSIDHKYQVAIDGQFRSLAGLSLSSLISAEGVGEKPLVSFLRFGAVATDETNRKVHYQQLVTQAFLNNPALVEKAQDGAVIEVPILRINMELSNALVDKKGDTLVAFDLKFTKPDGDPMTVRLVPKVRRLFIPTDSIQGEGDTVLTMRQLDSTLRAVGSLMTKADEYLKSQVTLTAKERSVIELLKGQLADYSATLIDCLSKDGSLSYFTGFGAEMQRFGARAALLAAKIGLMPAVNCNWGRDRTGAMDNEIKMLALKLEQQDEVSLQPIRLNKNEFDEDIDLRTQMLKDTGNGDIARQVNCRIHPINLRQTKGGLTGLHLLYDEETLAKEEV